MIRHHPSPLEPAFSKEMEKIWSASSDPSLNGFPYDRYEEIKHCVVGQCESLQAALKLEIDKLYEAQITTHRLVESLALGGPASHSDVAHPAPVVAEGPGLRRPQRHVALISSQADVAGQADTSNVGNELYQAMSDKSLMQNASKAATSSYDKSIGASVYHKSIGATREIIRTNFPDIHDLPNPTSRGETRSKNWYDSALDHVKNKTSAVHKVCALFGCDHLLPKECPKGALTKFVQSGTFTTIALTVIFLNTLFIGYEADVRIRGLLAVPKRAVPEWINLVGHVFSAYFGVEICFRILALRMWFFAQPGIGLFNLFDFILVFGSIISDVTQGIDVSWLRTLRVVRVIRVARLVRVLRFFKELRKMMFAIFACLASLMWALVFLGLLIFMFAIFFVQASATHLEANPDDNVALEIEKWYCDLPKAMFSLLMAISGGMDWREIQRPLDKVGVLPSVVFAVYVVWVNVGILNILTGIFVESAGDIFDRDLVVQEQMEEVEAFCTHMLNLYHEFLPDHHCALSWDLFRQYIGNEHVQAYLASHHLESTHAHMLFDLLDRDKSRDVTMEEFVLGLLKLKGEAKNLDSRIMLHSLGALHDHFYKMIGQLEALENTMKLAFE